MTTMTLPPAWTQDYIERFADGPLGVGHLDVSGMKILNAHGNVASPLKFAIQGTDAT